MNEKTYFGLIFIQGIASFIPSIAIAYFLMKLLEEGWTFFWVVLIAIYVFYFLIWVINTIISFFSFFLFKNRLINDTYSLLAQHKFPSPNKYRENKSGLPERYYINIIDDDSLDCKIRIQAAAMASPFIQLRQRGEYLSLFRIIKIHNRALNKYADLHFQDIN